MNAKPWNSSKQLKKLLEYSKSIMKSDLKNNLSSIENYCHKCQLLEFFGKANFMNGTRVSRLEDHYPNEEEMYELLFFSKQLQ